MLINYTAANAVHMHSINREFKLVNFWIEVLVDEKK